jgi:hypothetical protein
MPSSFEFSEATKARSEYREEFRREIARHVEPIQEAARDSDKSAVELTQSGIRTATLLNGGALVAIPAVVTLFGIDAKAIMGAMFIAGGFYVFGLIAAVLSSFLGALALSHRADREYSRADGTRANIEKFFYPKDGIENDAATWLEHHNTRFKIYRRLAIFSCALSLVGFVAGSSLGGWTILHAPLKAQHSTLQ